MSTKPSFIPHIAGLRGVAVLLVVAQHFGVPGFDAGFIGVDIFFVISGFLITGILLDEYSKSRDPESRIGGISLKAFYLRRARRIIPAATVVTLSIVVFSWFVNNSSRFFGIATDAIWATFFSANINFALKSTDYFQIGTAPSPFQHFWSLSVEEQFYFIWPALILATLAFRGHRFRGKLVSWQNRLFFLFTATSLASIAFMVVSFYFEPSLSYFLTASRAWELSLGAFAAIFIRTEKGLKLQNEAKYIAFLPLPLLITSLLLVRSSNFAYTLPLVVIAAAIFVAKPRDSKDWDARALSGRIPRFFGNISYSLYLWHWPVLIFGTEVGLGESFLGKALLATLALGMSTLSYYFVERKFLTISIPKFYSDYSVPPSKFAWISASVALTVGVLAIPSLAVQPANQTYVLSLLERPAIKETPRVTSTPQPTQEGGSDWFTKRQEEIQASNEALAKAGKLSDLQISEINRVADGSSYGNVGGGWAGVDGIYTLGKPTARTKVLAIGSSFTAMYMATYSSMAQSGQSIFVQIFTSGGCPNSLEETVLSRISPKKMHQPCVDLHKKVISHVRSHIGFYDFVVLGDIRWEGGDYMLSAVDFAKSVKRAGAKTVILAQPPTQENLMTCLNRDYSNFASCSNSRTTSIVDYRVAAASEVSFGDVAALFCLRLVCPAVINNAPTSVLGHLTDVSASSIAPFFLEFLREATVPPKD